MARAREVAAGTCMGKTRSGGSVLHVTRNTGRSIFRLLMIDGVSPAPTRRVGPPLPREGAGEGERYLRVRLVSPSYTTSSSHAAA